MKRSAIVPLPEGEGRQGEGALASGIATKRNTLWLCAIILFGAFVLRLWNLGTQSLWHDEAWSVMSAYQPFHPIDPNYPPLFTVLLGVWMQLAGDSVWAMRFWSLLFGVVTVAVMTLVTRRWYGHRAATIAAVLGAVSPILWVFSQEIRSYVLIPIQVIVLLALVDRLLRPRGEKRIARRVWLWLALTEILMLYTHNLAVPVVAWLNVTVAAVWLWRRDWKRLRAWILVQVGLLILYLPWLLTQSPTGTPLNTPPAINVTFLWNLWQSYFTGIKALVGADTQLMALTAAFGLIGLASVVAALVYRRSAWTWIVLSQVLLIPLFEAIIILAAHVDFHPRYFLAGVPATLILIAAGLDALVSRRWLSRMALASTLVLAGGILMRMVTVVYSSPIYQHDDFRAIAEHYAALGSDDAIIIPYGWEPTLDYYSRKMHFKAIMIGIPLHSSADTIIDRLVSVIDRTQHVEVLTWYQLPADVRGAYSCLLGAYSTTHDHLTVSGLRTDNYGGIRVSSDTRYIFGKVFNDSQLGTMLADFHKIQFWGTRFFYPGGNTACLMTRWRLPSGTNENWRIALRAYNYLDWPIAQTDSDILNDDQLPTSLWKGSLQGTAFSLVNLPEAVPFGIYPVGLTVYGMSNPGGLDLIADGKSAGRNLNLLAILFGERNSQPVQPTSEDVDLGSGLYLHRKDIPQGIFQPGQEVRITLEWWMTREWPQAMITLPVTLNGENWKQVQRGVVAQRSRMLTWYQFTIPATASGHVKLSVSATDTSDPYLLGEFDIAPINRTFTEPPELTTASRVNANFVGVGSLVGVNLPTTINHGEPPKMPLIWKPDATPDKAYTVFVHLLDSNGQVVAQSDAQPAGGSRPTTSWLPGEYISDSYTLGWNRPDYTGPATVEIGLYDQNTAERVKLTDGTDHVVLSSTVMVK